MKINFSYFNLRNGIIIHYFINIFKIVIDVCPTIYYVLFIVSTHRYLSIFASKLFYK